jgi:hypothetical protein
MSKPEHGPKHEKHEKPKLHPLAKELDRLQPMVVKRTQRILNPLSGHPLLSTMSNGFDGATHHSSEGERYTTSTAISDFQEASMAERNNPGRASQKAEKRAKNGIRQIKFLLSQEPVREQLDSGDPLADIDTWTRINGVAKEYPNLKSSFELIQLTISRIGAPVTEDDFDVFAAAVGFTQACLVNQLSLNDKSLNLKREKYGLRDTVMLLALGRLKAKHRNLAEYIIAQKTAQQLSKKTDFVQQRPVSPRRTEKR